MAEQVRLGLVGLGAQGSMYAQLITDGTVPNMEIGAICETNPVMAEAIQSTYPGVGFYRDLSTKEIVDGGEVGNIRHTSRLLARHSVCRACRDRFTPRSRTASGVTSRSKMK